MTTQTHKINIRKIAVEMIIGVYTDAGYTSRKYILKKINREGLIKNGSLTESGMNVFLNLWESKINGAI